MADAKERTRSYSVAKDGNKLTYTVTDTASKQSAALTVDLKDVFGVKPGTLAADAIESAIRTAGRYAVATKEVPDWQTALDDLLEQWTAGDWAVSGEGSVPFSVGAPLTKAAFKVHGAKFDGSALAVANALNEKLLAGLAKATDADGNPAPLVWDDLTDAEKNKQRREFEKQVVTQDASVGLAVTEIYNAQAAARAAKKLDEQKAKLAAGGGASLF